MKGDYLWDKSGPPDPDVEKLERELGKLRYRARPLPEAEPAETAPAAEQPRPAAPAPRRGRVIPIVFGLAAAAALLIFVGRDRLMPPPAPLATAARLGKPPAVAWETFDAALRPGDWLETGSWEAQVAIADIGRVHVSPATRIRLAETSGRTADGTPQHRLELARGKIHARVIAPPKVFVVGTPSADAIDLGCEYTLEVNEAGDGYLAVSWGWVELEAQSRKSLVPAGARARMQHGVGPGTPYFDDAPSALRRALERFDFGGGGADAVRAVLAEARRRDALTLWHLLPRVDLATRRDVYLKLKALAPPPADTTEPDVLRLDAPKLEHWKNDLSVTW